MAKLNIAKEITVYVKPIVDEMAVELVDVEFVKESINWFLRIYIDKPGGVTIDDCENVSKRVSEILDEKDPIEQSYFLEVSSPGLDRPLKKDSDFLKYAGHDVEVKLYKPINGSKNYEGKLLGLSENIISIENNGQKLEFESKDVSLVKLAVKL